MPQRARRVGIEKQPLNLVIIRSFWCLWRVQFLWSGGNNEQEAVDKDLLQNEKKHEFPNQAGKEKRALKFEMAGRGGEGVDEWDDSFFVSYTAGLCALRESERCSG
jgi:hypothetical protein